MSGENVNDKSAPPTISGAITYPQSHSQLQTIGISNNIVLPQPRQPQNLQGLLKFAVDATKLEDAPGSHQTGQMDEERKRFLEEALKSLTTDVIEILMEAIKKLKTAQCLDIESDISEYNDAFDSILEHVDRIDTANDFHKIGGFDIFEPCFNSVRAEIRANACDLIAELTQNNPYCQLKVLESNYMDSLLELLDKDIDAQVNVKALHALSCLLRDFLPAVTEFKKKNGFSVLMRSLEKPNDKLRIKACFLISALCSHLPEIKEELYNLGYIQLFISLVAENRKDSHEHVFSALNALVSGHEKSIAECRKPEYGFRSILTNHLNLIENSEEYQEEKEYCETLLKTLF